MNEEEIRNEAVSSLSQIMPWFRRIAYNSFNNKDFDLTRIQLLMVMALYYHGTVSMGTLAKLVGTSNEQVTRAAIKLEEKGFIIKIIEDYEKIDKINFLLKKYSILKKEYNEKIIIEALVNEEFFHNKIDINYEIINEIII